MDDWTIYFYSRIILFFLINGISWLSFYTARNNKYKYLIPILSIIWFPIAFYNSNTILDYLVPATTLIDYGTYYYGLILVPFSLLLIEGIQTLQFTKHKKLYKYTKSSLAQAFFLSLYPLFSIFSIVFYARSGLYEYLNMGPLVFIGIAFLDKVITLKYNCFIRQTVIKILLASIFLNYSSYEIIGEIIILMTDCLTGYILLQAKHDVKLRCFFKAMKYRLKNR